MDLWKATPALMIAGYAFGMAGAWVLVWKPGAFGFVMLAIGSTAQLVGSLLSHNKPSLWS
jgi:hypothetical protein